MASRLSQDARRAPARRAKPRQKEPVLDRNTVSQPLLLAHCDAFVTHGGFNSVKEALSVGVPMVVVPISADQPYSAERCTDLGVGLTVAAGDRSPDAIQDAVRQVLGDTGYRTAARSLQAEMAALPGPEQMVELLEALPLRTGAPGERK